MRRNLCYYLIFLALSLSCQLVIAQRTNRTGFDELFPQRARYVPVLDSLVNVKKLSRLHRDKLIDKIHKVDQMFRDSLMKGGWPPKSDREQFTSMISINDQVNRVILLKILRIDGWPGDYKKGMTSLSAKAWLIAWHARTNYAGLSKFYPYMVKASKAGCIDKNQFAQIDKAIKHLYAIGYR